MEGKGVQGVEGEGDGVGRVEGELSQDTVLGIIGM